MAEYNLTREQKELLKIIVDKVKSGIAREPLIPVSSHSDSSIIGVGNFGRNLLGDLEILAEMDLLGFRYNSQGNKIYTVKQSAYNAVENNFRIPEGQASPQINIGAIIREMSGGNVQAAGLNNQSTINQVINDPQLLQEKLDAIAEQLVEVVRTELHSKDLLVYIQSVDELKKQIQSERPTPSVLRKLFANISFVSDVESTISLAARVWPYVYPLLLITSQKLSSS
jgi:hypothetical protein